MWNYREFLPDEGLARAGGWAAAGAEGAEYAGRDSIGCVRGVGGAAGGENEGLGGGVGAGAGATRGTGAGAE